MAKLINTTGINTVNYLADYSKGKFRMISKTRAGWITSSDCRLFENDRLLKYPEAIISGYKKGALLSVEFCPDGMDFYITVFARQGNKIKIIDETILAALTVGTINQLFYNTNLYSQNQYEVVKAKTWDSSGYIMNKPQLKQTETKSV